MANVNAASEPCSCTQVLTADDDSTLSDQVTECASALFKQRLAVCSSSPRDICVVLADDQGTGLTMDHVSMMHDPAADADPPSFVLFYGPDAAATRGRSLLAKHLGGIASWRRCHLQDGGCAAPGSGVSALVSAHVGACKSLHLRSTHPNGQSIHTSSS